MLTKTSRGRKSEQALGIVKSRNLIRQLLGGSILALAFFMLSFLVVPYLISEASATVQLASADVDWSAATLALDPDYGATGSGDVDFGNIIPTSKVTGTSYGSLRVVKKTIGVTTSGSHFAIYLSTNGTTTGLNLVTSGSGDSAVTDSSTNIPALTNTIASPTTFMTRANKGWGYNVPNAGTNGSVAGASDFNGNTALVTDATITSNSTGTAASTYSNSLWAGITNVDNPVMIWSATTSNIYGFGGENGDANNHFDIYYGVAVDTNVLAGTYQNKVLYTAIASTDAVDTVSSNILRSGDEFVAGGNTLTLEFDLTHSVPTQTLTESDFTITLIPHGALYDSTESRFDYDKTATELATLSGVSCPVATNSLSMTTGDSTTRSSITCTLPANDAEDGSGNASYDIWVHIDRYNIDYLSHYTYEYDDGDIETEDTYDVATITYAGLQSYFPNTGSTYGSAATYTDPRFTENTTLYGATNGKIAHYMQDITSNICKMTNKWGTTLGLDARVYDYTGTGDALASTMNSSMELNVGTFALKDERDNKDYLVRHLADGNCWMVQNLDLDLSTVSTLTPDDSDVSENWDPYASVNTKTTQLLADEKITGNTFQDFAEWQLGLYPTQQYQNSTQSGTIAWRWGSRRSNDSQTYEEMIATLPNNNAYAQVPRSYDNTIYGTGEIRFIATDISNGKRYNQINISDPTDTSSETGWVEGSFSNDTSDIGTNDSSFNPTGKLNLPSGTWNYYGSMYIGKYYNWYAVTAETGTYSMGSDNAESSICPSGWELPYGNSADRSWRKLLVATYGLSATNGGSGETDSSLKVRQAPLSLTLTGHYLWNTDTQPLSRGTQGTFASKTSAYAGNVSHLSISSNGRMAPDMAYVKIYGFSVRCVARD